MEMYHCFWIEPTGAIHKYEATEDFDRVHKLVVENEKGKSDDDYSNVKGLRVIYGELLEFEPVEVVSRWKIKNEKA